MTVSCCRGLSPEQLGDNQLLCVFPPRMVALATEACQGGEFGWMMGFSSKDGDLESAQSCSRCQTEPGWLGDTERLTRKGERGNYQL